MSGTEDDAYVPSDEEPEPGTTTDLTDPRAPKRALNKRRRETAEAAQFWRSVFADEVGRRIMWDILKDSHAFETRFACAGDGSPYEAARNFQAGEAAFGFRLWKTWMKLAREGCLLMMQEFDAEIRPDV